LYPGKILRVTLANLHLRHNMTQARGEVNGRRECVTRKPVLLCAYYFTTQEQSQVKYG
jgi:hypothetical protein